MHTPSAAFRPFSTLKYCALRTRPAYAACSRLRPFAIQNSAQKALYSMAIPPVTSEATPSSQTVNPVVKPTYAASPIPPNPLGEGNCIRRAAALIIGDEILNGKTQDSNSNFFARYCFEQGIELKRIEVISDNEEEIIEASRRLVQKYDFVITTGGIGPTHDDITYQSLAAAFNQDLAHHPETLKRMDGLARHRRSYNSQTPEQRTAMHRMALFPDQAEVLFVNQDSWVPVIRLEGKLCVFPGIPKLFQRMLTELTPYLPLPPKSERPLRIQIFTNRLESMIAPYLTSLQKRVMSSGVQVGSYPVMGKGVFVSLIGRDPIHLESGTLWLADIAREVEREIGGRVASEEEVVSVKQEAVVKQSEEGFKSPVTSPGIPQLATPKI